MRFSKVAVGAVLLLSASATLAKVTINGTATDSEGLAISGASITVLDSSGAEVAATQSDKKGKFKVSVETAGQYVVHIEAEGYGPHDSAADLEAGVDMTAKISLIDRSIYDQQLAVDTFNGAVGALQAGDLDAAEEGFHRALELNPALVQAHGALANVYHGKEDWDSVLAALERLPAGPLPPQLAPVAFDAYRKTDDLEKAKTTLALVDDPAVRKSLAIGVYNDGVAYSKADDMEKARAHLELAAEIDPSMAAADRSLAALEFNEADFEAALPHLDELLRKEPADAAGLRMRFLALDRLGREDLTEAMGAYLDSADDSAADQILKEATEAFEQNATAQALRRLRPLVALRPQMARAQFKLGLALASSGDPAGAKEHLQSFVDLDPSHPDAETATAMISQL